MSPRPRLSLRRCFALAAWALACGWPAVGFAHGWHNAALTTSSLAQWLSDVKAAVPDVMERLNQTELKSVGSLEELKRRAKASREAGGAKRGTMRGGKLEAELTPRQQALLGRKADDCLEALAFMDPDNIFPSEFPNFPVDDIPKYRETAAKLLRVMGRPGAAAVVNELRSILMGGGRLNNATDYQVHRDYFPQLLSILREAGETGNLSVEDEQALEEAAAGQKPYPIDELAAGVLDALDDIKAAHANLAKLAQLIDAARGSDHKRRLQSRLREQLPDATIADLLELLQAKPERNIRQLALIELEKRFKNCSELELLEIVAAAVDPVTDRRAAAELAQRSPRYSEVKQDLDAIADLAGSDRPEAAEAARRQIANAYQRAPMGRCLTWLGKADESLKELTWQQIDGRIARADENRLASYRDTALERLEDEQAPPSEHQAALDLLGRLPPKLVVEPLLDALPRLRRESWAPAGDVLRRLTRQDFGPRPGDGAAELIVELRKWREWLKERQEQGGQ